MAPKGVIITVIIVIGSCSIVIKWGWWVYYPSEESSFCYYSRYLVHTHLVRRAVACDSFGGSIVSLVAEGSVVKQHIPAEVHGETKLLALEPDGQEEKGDVAGVP